MPQHFRYLLGEYQCPFIGFVNVILLIMIYHITTQVRWDEWTSQREFAPEAYEKEKFIHCCKADQIQGVLDRYFKGSTHLLLLCLEEQKLTAPLRYEPGTNNELFPHLYGTINKDAIIEIRKI